MPWCDAEPGRGRPAAHCNCHEGRDGEFCEEAVLMACLNQCNGRGVCHFGFCRCDPGWYGIDCSLHQGRVKALAVAEEGEVHAAAGGAAGAAGAAAARAAGAAGAAAAAAAAGTEAAWAVRPLIYVYELPPRFTTEMWSTKTEKKDCTIRAYTSRNSTRYHMHAFGMEVAARQPSPSPWPWP